MFIVQGMHGWGMKTIFTSNDSMRIFYHYGNGTDSMTLLSCTWNLCAKVWIVQKKWGTFPMVANTLHAYVWNFDCIFFKQTTIISTFQIINRISLMWCMWLHKLCYEQYIDALNPICIRNKISSNNTSDIIMSKITERKYGIFFQ